MNRLRLRHPDLDFWIDVRVRHVNGHWLAVADLADEPDIGVGDAPTEAMWAALSSFSNHPASRSRRGRRTATTCWGGAVLSRDVQPACQWPEDRFRGHRTDLRQLGRQRQLEFLDDVGQAFDVAAADDEPLTRRVAMITGPGDVVSTHQTVSVG